MHRKLLSFITVAVLWGACCACESDYTGPSFSCTGYTMQISMQDSTGTALKVNNNTFFRTTTDTGSYKLLALEALVDSFKLIFNLKNGPYTGDALMDDGFPVKIYSYNKDGRIADGLVLAGIIGSNGISYYETDTSSVTLTNWDPHGLTMSGSYYFEANNHSVKGSGSFSNVCFISLK